MDVLERTVFVCDVNRSFVTVAQHYPDFSTRDIHSNYVDCARWFGRFVLSKVFNNVLSSYALGLLSSLHKYYCVYVQLLYGRVRMLLVFGYWVLGNIHRYWYWGIIFVVLTPNTILILISQQSALSTCQ